MVCQLQGGVRKPFLGYRPNQPRTCLPPYPQMPPMDAYFSDEGESPDPGSLGGPEGGQGPKLWGDHPEPAFRGKIGDRPATWHGGDRRGIRSHDGRSGPSAHGAPGEAPHAAGGGRDGTPSYSSQCQGGTPGSAGHCTLGMASQHQGRALLGTVRQGGTPATASQHNRGTLSMASQPRGAGKCPGLLMVRSGLNAGRCHLPAALLRPA